MDGITFEQEGSIVTVIRDRGRMSFDQRERIRNEKFEYALLMDILDLPGVRKHGSYRERLESAIDVVHKIISPPPPDKDSPEGRALRIDAKTKVDLNDPDKVEEMRIEAWADHYAVNDDYAKTDAIWKTWSSQAGRFELTDNTLVPQEGWPPNLTAEKYIRAQHVEADARAHEVAPEDDVEVEPDPEPEDVPADPDPEPEPAPGETAALLEAALKGSN